MSLASAASRDRSTASRRRPASSRRGAARCSESASCSRDRSMISCTSAVSRAARRCIRPAKRRTASGSSERPARPRRAGPGAPTGVLSSWLTLATKSRRTSSTPARLGAVLDEQQHVLEPSGATRAATTSPGRPAGPAAAPARPRGSRRRGAPVGPGRAARAAARSCPRTRPRAYAAGRVVDDRVGRVEDDRRGPQHGEDVGDAVGTARTGPPVGAGTACCRRSERRTAYDGARPTQGDAAHRTERGSGRHVHPSRVGGRASSPDRGPSAAAR